MDNTLEFETVGEPKQDQFSLLPINLVNAAINGVIKVLEAEGRESEREAVQMVKNLVDMIQPVEALPVEWLEMVERACDDMPAMQAAIRALIEAWRS